MLLLIRSLIRLHKICILCSFVSHSSATKEEGIFGLNLYMKKFRPVSSILEVENFGTFGSGTSPVQGPGLSEIPNEMKFGFRALVIPFNQETTYLRNRIRRSIKPQLMSLSRRWSVSLALREMLVMFQSSAAPSQLLRGQCIHEIT